MRKCIMPMGTLGILIIVSLLAKGGLARPGDCYVDTAGPDCGEHIVWQTVSCGTGTCVTIEEYADPLYNCTASPVGATGCSPKQCKSHFVLRSCIQEGETYSCVVTNLLSQVEANGSTASGEQCVNGNSVEP